MPRPNRPGAHWRNIPDPPDHGWFNCRPVSAYFTYAFRGCRAGVTRGPQARQCRYSHTIASEPLSVAAACRVYRAPATGPVAACKTGRAPGGQKIRAAAGANGKVPFYIGFIVQVPAICQAGRPCASRYGPVHSGTPSPSRWPGTSIWHGLRMLRGSRRPSETFTERGEALPSVPLRHLLTSDYLIVFITFHAFLPIRGTVIALSKTT